MIQLSLTVLSKGDFRGNFGLCGFSFYLLTLEANCQVQCNSIISQSLKQKQKPDLTSILLLALTLSSSIFLKSIYIYFLSAWSLLFILIFAPITQFKLLSLRSQ